MVERLLAVGLVLIAFLLLVVLEELFVLLVVLLFVLFTNEFALLVVELEFLLLNITKQEKANKQRRI